MFVLCKCSRIVGIDLDNCVGEDLQVSKEAVELIEEFDTYTEASPSGTGFKMLLWGEKPGSACRKKDVFGCSEIEIYEHARFWAMTGNVVSDGSAEIEPRQEELEDLYSELFPPKPERPASSIDGFGRRRRPFGKARDAANGGKFTRLYDAGDISMAADALAADLPSSRCWSGLADHGASPVASKRLRSTARSGTVTIIASSRSAPRSMG